MTFYEINMTSSYQYTFMLSSGSKRVVNTKEYKFFYQIYFWKYLSIYIAA